MADEDAVTTAKDRAGDGGAVANVEVDPREGGLWIRDPGDIGKVDEGERPSPTRYATAGARSECSTGNASNRSPASSNGLAGTTSTLASMG